MKRLLILYLFCAFYSTGNAQCPTSKFSVDNESLCRGENISLTNQTGDALKYEWDFCSGDLENTPSTINAFSSSSFDIPVGTTIVKQNNIYYGFVCSRGNNKIFLMEFGDSPNNVPKIIKEFTGAALNGPEWIEFVQEGDDWIGFVLNFNDSHLIRMHFKGNINLTPLIEDLGNLGGVLDGPRGLELKESDSHNYLFINNTKKNNIVRVEIKDNWLGPLLESDVGLIGSGSGLKGPLGISLIDSCGVWYGIVSSNANNKFYHLSFGTDLTSSPLIREIGNASGPTDVKWAVEGGEYYVFGTGASGNVFRINFGNNPGTLGTIENLGTFGEALNTAFGFDIVKDRSTWQAFSMSYSKKQLTRLDFENICNANISFTTEREPKNVYYTSPGEKIISLKVTDENKRSISISKKVTVLDQQAPQVAIQADVNLCLDNSKNFSAENLTPTQTLTSQTWDFGDGTTATGEEVTHQYTESGTYKVRLTVESENGCGNFIENEVNIYAAPAPDFSFPTTSICTNGEVSFTNTTPGEYKEEDITWSWDFGDGTSSDEKSPTHTYTTGGTKTVTLTASIPGCIETKEYEVTVVEGPSVNFVVDHLCFGDVVQFTNLSSGADITDFEWDFGNGETSTVENPTMEFDAAGEYDISLTVTNAIGCSNIFSQTVKINALPQVSFENGIACSGTSTAFHDKSTVANGSISSWKWDFGDGAVSTQKNPTHIFTEAGAYDVKLVVTTVAGCIDSVTQTVDVNLAPIADFEVEIGCPGALTQFTNTSQDPAGSGLEVNYWIINGIYHYTPNPAVLFTKAGTYGVTLVVTSGVSCKSTITKNIVVDPLPTPDFIFENACVGGATLFTDQSQASGGDEIANWKWEFGNFETSEEQNPAIEFPGEGNYAVTLTVTTARGCSAIINKTVTINALPKAAFVPQNNFGAPPLEVKFKNNSTGAISYQWHFGDAENSTSEEAEPVFVYTEVGDYEVQMIATNAGGCSDTAKVNISVLISEVEVALEKINVYTNTGNMQVVLTIRNEGTVPVENMNINLDLGGKISLNERFTGVINPGMSYNYPLGFDILAADLPNVAYICANLAVTGVAREEVDLTNNSLCHDIKGVFLLTEPYPNPVDHTLNVEFFMPDDVPVRLILSDVLGNAVMDFEVPNAKKGLNAFHYDFSQLAAGMYVLMISHKEESFIRRLIVQ